MMREQVLHFLNTYLDAVQSGATGAELARFYTEDAVLVEHPNIVAPKGATRDFKAIVDALEKGQAAMARQSFDVHSAIIEGDRAALSVSWVGVLKSGAEMRARFAQFYTLRDGKIARQETFDCFES
jgi:ketosteroid isomerase-like protein